MDGLEFKDRIHSLSAKIRELREHIETEEGTKATFINPFLNLLGYDTTDPRVVVFEYTADVGLKKGEKVDYAIKRNGDVIMLIEAKKVGCELDRSRSSQLFRYFNVTSTARIAVLTNGIRYEFYSDLDKSNIMDEKPFMIFDFEALEESLLPELQKLANDSFNIDTALSAAQDLKHLRQIKSIIKTEIQNPSEAFIKFFASKICDCAIRSSIIEDFKPKVKAAFNQFLNDEIFSRIQNITKEKPAQPTEEMEENNTCEKNEQAIVTTAEELEAFMIVKAILRPHISVEKIAIRDKLSYCGVLYEDNNRKPICRFYFNSEKVKYLAVFNEEKQEIKHKIEKLDDIYNYSSELVKIVNMYIEPQE